MPSFVTGSKARARRVTFVGFSLPGRRELSHVPKRLLDQIDELYVAMKHAHHHRKEPDDALKVLRMDWSLSRLSDDSIYSEQMEDSNRAPLTCM